MNEPEKLRVAGVERERRSALARSVLGRYKGLGELAEEYGVSEEFLWTEWLGRADWLSGLLGLNDASQLVVDEVASWKSFIDECLELARKLDADGARTAAANALKNAREAKQFLSGFLQSLGLLPRVASEYLVEKVELDEKVNMNESEADVLVKAAAFLNKKRSGKTEPDKLH